MARTVVFDFDGVIHSYRSGWQGAAVIPDPPVPGINAEIQAVRAAGFKVVVLSARCHQKGGMRAIAAWLDRHGITVDGIVNIKPPAVVYVDDRAICFNGQAAGLAETVIHFRNWLSARP